MQVSLVTRSVSGYGLASRVTRQIRRPGMRGASVRNPPKATVVCIGEALFDLIADDSEKGKSKTEVQSWTPFAGGAPCNVATALGMLGVDVSFVSALGTDQRGHDLMRLMEVRNVKTDSVQRRPEPTRDVYVTRDLAGDREFAGFGLSSDKYCDNFIQADELPAEEIQKASVLVTGTLGLAAPDTRAALHKAAQLAKSGARCLVFVDVNWRPVFWDDHDVARSEITKFLEQADIVKLSDADLEWLFGIDPMTALKDPCQIALRLPNASGVLVTAGGLGASYCFKQAAGDGSVLKSTLPVFKVDVVETTGAGDAFTAGFIYKMLQADGLQNLAANAASMKDAVVFASAAGALTTTGKGAIEAQPSLDAVEHLFRQGL